MSYPQNIAKKFVKQTKGIKYWNGKYYIYVDGCYESLSADDFESKLIAFLELQYNSMSHTSALIGNTMRNVKSRIKIPDKQENNSWLNGVDREAIAFNNGLLVKFTPKISVLKKHNPDFFNLNKLPYDYDKKAKCPRWLSFLDEIMEGDADRIKLLQQWVKYILGNSLKEHTFLLLVGFGGTGKSTFIDVIQHLVGLENVSNVPLARFGDKFSMSSLIGKKLNTFAETSKEINRQEEEKLKAYVTGDRMMFEKKYKDAFSSFPTAKLMFSTNELPQFHDKTDALWERMRYIPFDVKFRGTSRQDKDLKGKLFSELPGIFNWADSTDISKGLINPKMCKDAVERYRREMNPAIIFLEEHYEYDESGSTPCDRIYSTYKVWCNINGYKPLSDTNFGKEVFKQFRSVRKARPRDGLERYYAYGGLRKLKSVRALHTIETTKLTPKKTKKKKARIV